jgi:hypothetical protein
MLLICSQKKSNVTHLALFFLEFSFQTSCNSATIQKNAVMISEQHIATMPHDSDQCQQSELMIIAFIQGSRPLYYAKSNDAVRPTHGDVCLALPKKEGFLFGKHSTNYKGSCRLLSLFFEIFVGTDSSL